MRQLAYIADRWDKGYGHFTTRQNIQFNWRVCRTARHARIAGGRGDARDPDVGQLRRNVTADHFAGAAADEIADPRPFAELLRQWSTDHPEFQFLPRKFKIAITGLAQRPRGDAAHDIGLRVLLNDAGEVGFEVSVGVRAWPDADAGPRDPGVAAAGGPAAVRRGDPRRLQPAWPPDNKYKARIKIAVHEMGLETLKALVEERFIETRREFSGSTRTCWRGSPSSSRRPLSVRKPIPETAESAGFRAWREHERDRAPRGGPCDRDDLGQGAWRDAGRRHGRADAAMADIADAYSYGELRITTSRT